MRALVVALVTMLTSCMLLVSPEEYGDVCRFKGEDTQCGACVAAKCRADIDNCCRDENCDLNVVDRLDRCTQAHDDSCHLMTATDYPLSSCIARECGPQCQPLTGTSETSCREPRLGEGSACTCSAGGDANDFVCNADAFPDTICCAVDGWPAPGLACTCRPLDCRPTDDGCFCKLADFTPKQRECGAVGVHCCAEKDTCTCQTDPCAGFQREVPSCNVAELVCPDGKPGRSTCSVRTP